MTNFIYEKQERINQLMGTIANHGVCSFDDYITLKELLDHIENQGKQLRELNAAITKRNKTIEKYEHEKEELQERNSYLYKKVVELNNGIRDSEDLTWKQKYEALLHSSEQAICTLQKKCQEYKNDAILSVTKAHEITNELKDEYNPSNYIQLELTCHKYEQEKKDLEKRNKELEDANNGLYRDITELEKLNKKLERSNLDMGDTIGLYVEEFKKLTAKNKELEDKLSNLPADKVTDHILYKNRVDDIEYLSKRCNKAEKELEAEKKIIAAFEETLDTKNKALEKERQVSKDLNVIINNKNKLLDEYMTKYEKLVHMRNELIVRNNELSFENKKLEAEKKSFSDRWFEAEKELTAEKQANKDLNAIVARFQFLND